MKRYTNFDEIDRDLKFLRLKSKIDWEEIKLSLHHTKQVARETFSPINFIIGVAGSVAKKAIFLKVAQKVVTSAMRKMR